MKVSTGRNWGYGSAVPPRDGAALLSLARLDRINGHDDMLGTVTIEPGVTFRRLAHALAARGSRLLAPSTGSSPDTSVVGNALERGIGQGFYEDMAGRVRGCDAVLATGETIRLSADRAGPALLGLLPQANFAVVTAMTIRLDPAPRLRQFASVSLPDVSALARCLDASCDLLQRGAGRVQLAAMNDYRFLAQRGQFPYQAFDGATPLPRAWVAEQLGLSPRAEWIAGITLWGDCADELGLRRNALNAALGAIGPIHCGEAEAVTALNPGDHDGLRCAYWRKRFPMPADPDPDHDRCGVLWIAPTLPLRGEHAAALVTEVEPLMLRHGFEPTLSLRIIGGRSIRAIIGLLFDRDEAGADASAIRCRNALLERLGALRLEQYRHGLLDGPPHWDAATGKLLAALKSGADPGGILAPGRYGLA